MTPDVRILEWRPFNGHYPDEEDEGGVAIAESRTFVMEAVESTEGYIEIREADGSKVVTIIEFHSPANKSGGVGNRQVPRKASPSHAGGYKPRRN